MSKLKDLTGMVFGKLTVIERGPNSASGKTRWRCQCECGNIALVHSMSLKRVNGTTSCGCTRIEDLTGMVSGKITVLERASNTEDGKPRWVCRCDCGNVITTRGSVLRSGSITSCGCARIENLTGQVFGQLTVLERGPNTTNGDTRWYCICVCGNKVLVHASSLKNHDSQSCGCLRNEKIRQANTKHGQSYVLEFRTWTAMIARCTKPEHPNYHNYGGRGITVCDRWRHSYENFISDMGLSGGLTLDRKDNNGPYSPDNCRWVTQKEQCNNTRRNVYVDYQGERITIAQLADITGISYMALWHRIITYGLTPEQAVAKSLCPPKVNNAADCWIEFQAEYITVAQLADRFQIPYDYLYEQLSLGYSPEEIVNLCLSYR